MKLAIVQDGLMCKAGGEQVALAFHKAFPDAPIYTLAYNSEYTFEEFKNVEIKTSFIQYISNKDAFVKKIFFPLGIIAAHLLDVSEYDIVLMSTTHCAKYVKVNPKAKVFCYAHNPFRLAWYPNEYKIFSKTNFFRNFLFKNVIRILQRLDKRSIKKVNFLLTNSKTVEQRLKDVYDNYSGSITIIPPPVKFDSFFISTKKDYFLIVSRLESYKRVDLAIKVFNKLNLPLIVVGKGTLECELKSMANKNIIFMKDLSTEELAKVYSQARAFIFPQLEDFGITPLEANASGVPVIAYGFGGVLDTQRAVDHYTVPEQATAIFFDEQTVEKIEDAVNKFLEIEQRFDTFFLREYSKSFSESYFINKIRAFVHQNT